MGPSLTSATTVAIVGAGPAGLMAAEILATAGASVTVFDRMPSPGRKLLLAGRGGLNLTHTEDLDTFLERYGPARATLAPAITAFDPSAVRAWSDGLGAATFVGTSGRVFPTGLRATPLLRAWLRRLESLGVELRGRHEWVGWRDDDLVFTTAAGDEVCVHRDVTVLALGGASWPRTGSDGGWVGAVEEQHIAVAPLRPANGGFVVRWSPVFASSFAGTPLKNVTLTHDDATIRGEAMITATGIEGGAVYALSRDLRASIDRDGQASLTLDLQPDRSVDDLTERLAHRRPKDSLATGLRRVIGVPPVMIALLREATGNDLPRDDAELARLLKAVRLVLVAPQPIDRAISTAGGIRLDEIDDTFMLRRRPGTFVAGEMLDWEAPTGGYLLQATFSTAVAAARGAVAWLTAPPTP
jgi:uncharacterized flavoprotein (TIGR03862 family)